ncbi:MAG: MmgE/PrpD family protein [Desulfobacteraceae bacterium]|nr:MmgE/PrpD family protein [Desulfobacteraceae bacterium]
MDVEEKLVEHILNTHFNDLPEQAIEIGKTLILTVLGTTIAGATSEGCEAVLDQINEWGGSKEATIIIYGGQAPAHNAALINSIMARALDFCDGMVPGLHLGSTCVPAALAAAELTEGCNGKDFLTYLIVGAEAAARINSCSMYNGFDPTGVCSIFAATAIAGRMLNLNPKQMLDALALAFNRSGGSLQSNIDGAGAVRIIQGSASQGGIICAQLAKKGITGPKNFLKGQYGYFHLYADDQYNPKALFGGWGERFDLTKLVFKRYPSCWSTTSSIDAILEVVREKGLNAEDVERIDITMTPSPYKLVGHPFEVGDNPRVNAQFNVRYCVASALLRKGLRLKDFDEPAIRDPKIMEITDRIYVTPDPDLEKQGHNAAVVLVKTTQGITYETIVGLPRGSPESPLTRGEHIERFNNCFGYAGKPLPQENAERILSMVSQLEELPDICNLIPLLLS